MIRHGAGLITVALIFYAQIAARFVACESWRDFQLAFAARQSPLLLCASLRNVGCGIVNATARRISAAAFRNSLAACGIREQRSFCGRNCCADLHMSRCAPACARCSGNSAVARIPGPCVSRVHGNGNVVWLLVRVERLRTRALLDMVPSDAGAARWTFL
jgi:hypothetical protein